MKQNKSIWNKDKINKKNEIKWLKWNEMKWNEIK